ncbi:formin homology 2 domain containing isoform X2 [Lycorma delicatula]|uniref:formin homology 2 domain containing isoform X2 n=1 Tax=Lycorma delicatula TaxID=130591 RepID=UPI003F51481D
MSSYRTYVPWSSSRGSTYSSDKTPSLTSSVDRGSSTTGRYGGSSSYRAGSGSSSITSGISSYRPGSLGRTGTTDTTSSGGGSAVSSIRDKYSGRTTATQDADKPLSRRYGVSTYQPPEPPKTTPTLRFGSTSRFGGQIARSPISEKSPTVFGVSTDQEQNGQKVQPNGNEGEISDKMTVITRATSPTPPSNSTYLRARRADMERTIQRQVPRPVNKPLSTNSESQTDEKGILKRETKREEKETHSRTSSTTPWTSSRFSTSSYTPSTSSASTRYSPRTTSSSYSYTRPTDLPLRSTTLSKTPEKESSTKTTPVSPKEGRDPTRIGGFSYARPTDLPNLTSLNKILSSESVDSDRCKTTIKRSVSPLTPEKKVPLIGLTKDTIDHSSSFQNKSPNDSKLVSPDRSKLPPPVPKSDSNKTVANKDFRKSVLNMDLSSSSEDAKSIQKSVTKNSLSQSKSLSRLPAGQKLPVSKLRELVVSKSTPSSSSEESSTESTESSSSESTDEDDDEGDEDDDDDNTNPNVNSLSKDLTSKISGTKIPSSPSRTSAQMTSTDEGSGSISIEKPPRPPSSPRPRIKIDDSKTEEAKAVVCRVLAPVANQMKKTGLNSSSDDLSDKNATKKDLQRNISSKDLRRNLSSKDLHRNLSSKDLQRNHSSKDLQRNLSNKNIANSAEDKRTFALRKFDSGEAASWTDSNDTATKSPDTGQYLTVPEINDCKQGYKIKRIESGEKAWWLQSSSDIPSTGKVKSASNSSLNKSESKSDVTKEPKQAGCRIKRIESGERAWWMSSSSDVPGLEKCRSKTSLPRSATKSPDCRIKRIESGEKAGWQQQDSRGENTSSGIEPVPKDTPSSGKESDVNTETSMANGVSVTGKPYYESKIRRIESGNLEWWLDSDEERKRKEEKRKIIREKPFIGRHTNIDDVLGTQAPPPAAFRTPRNTSSEDSDSGDELFINADQVRIHDSSAKRAISMPGMIKLDDTALQLYKDGDYGSYLDLEASINEQQEEFEDFNTNRKNSIVLRTQLSVRVHTIIEKLLNSEGRELRRALFSLKQIFQEDKDLVHEFVQNDGLNCLIKVGSDADQNYQNYILRALGQVMLYVDGMNGVMEHPGTIQWLYSLVSSKFRLVVKTALKLLLVFVEYVDTNSVLLVKAIRAVDYVHSSKPWSNVMKLLKDYDSADTELLIYATSLINKTLNGLPDQDSYYDQVDALEEQGLESVIRRYMSKQGTDLDLLRQFQIYEAVLHHEDGEDKGTPLRQLDETVRKTLRNRKCLTATLPHVERRKSRRHSTGTSPSALTLNLSRLNTSADQEEPPAEEIHNDHESAGVTPALRRRRERAERQRSFIREQREASLRASVSSTDQSSSEDGGAVRNGIQNGDPGSPVLCNGDSTSPLRRDNTVKDLSQKLASTLHSPEGVNNMKGIISKAKEGLALAKSQSRGDLLKSPTGETPAAPRTPEVKKSETDLHWEELLATTTRELSLCDLDFTDLASDEDHDVLAPACRSNGIPPPPPPCGGPPPAPIPAIPNLGPPPGPNPPRLTSPIRKSKKTVKLFWKEVREDPLVITKLNTRSLIWDELSPVSIDTQKLEHLFESRAKDLITKEKQQELNKNKEIIVLDPKRSNAINIGMTKLPPPRSIKTAILKMDATVMNREGIEKLLTMLPSEEERSKIQEAQATNPDLPLGSAEQFLLTLASISELAARLKLWAFKLDYENCEKEIAEPLMDLKQGMETLKANKTFKAILGTLLSIGIFLNGNEVKGFQIEYLSKVPEVKDTVHKHSLLHHLCHIVMEKFPDSTDLYSEIGAVTRASKVDFDELASNIIKMEQECKASFDHLKVIAKHDGSTNMKVKMSDFLADCAERIIVLGKVHRRVINRYHKFCLWLGIPLHRVHANKPNELCRVISEFALEYRTTRERVLQQLEKKASHRERNKTRGKMITEVGKFRTQEDRADAELRQLLGNDHSNKDNSLTGSLPWRRTKKDLGHTGLSPLSREDGVNGNLTDADDEILESLVKTATKTPTTRTTPRERKRTRHADRKSLIKRSRTRDNMTEGNISGSA